MQVYGIVMPETSVSAAKDLIRASAPSTAAMVLIRAGIFNVDLEVSNQVGAVIRRATADGTGTANTPRAYKPQSPSFPGTAIHNLSADATAGDELYQEGFNILNGFLWVPTPDERIWIPPSGRIVLRLDSAPAGATLLTAVMVVGIIS